MLGLGVVMFCFTGLDLASGVHSLALWLGLVAWAVVIGCCWWILKETRNAPTSDSSKEGAQ